MLKNDRIDLVLRRILVLALAGSAGCGNADGGVTTNLTIDTTGFEPVPCAERLSGLALVSPADYIELYRSAPYGSLELVDSTGTPCATASAKDACQNALNALEIADGFLIGQCFDDCPLAAVVLNRGDEVSAVLTEDQMLAELGAIDSPMDAIMRVQMAGYQTDCSNSPVVKVVNGGYEVLASRETEVCAPVVTTRYRLHVSSTGQTTELESDIIAVDNDLCIGRKPAGLASFRCRNAREVGAHFANIAYLEAASVDAFEILKKDLTRHGAPARLVRQIRKAKREEVRHALVTARLANRYGASSPPAPVIHSPPPRSLEEIAIENAVEGCTKETFGALVGAWQAQRANDPAVRRVMRRIAVDETRHAALSWAIDRWAQTRLSEAGRSRVDEARKAALLALLKPVTEPSAALADAAGLPNAKEHAVLAEQFFAVFSAS